MATDDANAWSRGELRVGNRTYQLHRLKAVEEQGIGELARLPRSIRILLENQLRKEDGVNVTRADIEAVARWSPDGASKQEIAFSPARVLLQDFTGVPAVVDLAAMRDAMADLGGDPSLINPLCPADLVIDHSVQVDHFGSNKALELNAQIEFERNAERYEFLRWGQSAFERFRVVPPSTGIVHQVNLEYLAPVVFTQGNLAYPDTLVGTDSHTTMINGLGVVGWGVGGIEAEACLLGQPVAMLIPDVVGFKLKGALPAGATATDLVLTVVQMLREHGVVGKFVEFYGGGLQALSLADRATVANMGPEYGATIGFFPVDEKTLDYLRLTGRPEEQIDLVEAYCKEQGLFASASDPDPEYSSTLELDLSEVQPSISGPRRPQDRVLLRDSKPAFASALKGILEQAGDGSEAAHSRSAKVNYQGDEFELTHGRVVIAAITSCTNTSNPSVMLAAGLLAKNAVERGLTVKPWVKTSLAPGSKVVSDYLGDAGVLLYLEKLRFNLVGYGCTTCIGNSGPLPAEIDAGVKEADLVAVSVLSGNRNFEGRISQSVRANYLASPPLVVAYAIAGRMDIDLNAEPLGTDNAGKPVMLSDIWPHPDEIQKAIEGSVKSEMYRARYSKVFEGDATWRAIPIPEGNRYAWSSDSTYIQKPTFFQGMGREPGELEDIRNARVLALLGDSITTDHISPAGSIPAEGPAGRYLIEHGVQPGDFNSFGSRRGNHEVMWRGTFANIRLRNQLAPGTEGGITKLLPSGEQMSIFDAAEKYAEQGTALVVLAGTEYGSGSSRDWAAKGTALLGVRAVIAKSFERIHRSNLIGMGVLPLVFEDGEGPESLGLTGHEVFGIEGVASMTPGARLRCSARGDAGDREFHAIARIDTPQELEYFRHGGILKYVLRELNT